MHIAGALWANMGILHKLGSWTTTRNPLTEPSVPLLLSGKIVKLKGLTTGKAGVLYSIAVFLLLHDGFLILVRLKANLPG